MFFELWNVNHKSLWQLVKSNKSQIATARNNLVRNFKGACFCSQNMMKLLIFAGLIMNFSLANVTERLLLHPGTFRSHYLGQKPGFLVGH